MSENQKQALAELTAHNQITVVADTDHRNEGVSEAVRSQLAGMAANGVKHLFLEHDARDVTVAEIRNQGGAYAAMTIEAQALGIEIHLMDDRSRQRNYADRYPEEAAYARAHDTYRENPEALIAGAQNPEKMRDYLNEIEANDGSDIEFRNARMVENIADVMERNPNDKAVVMVGASHVYKGMDVDEGLRLRGLQTTTAQIDIFDPQQAAPDGHARAPDKADILVASTGEAMAYKIPNTNVIKTTAALPQGTKIPWENREPVADRNHPWMLCALDAAKGVDCSWNHAATASPVEANPGETGQMGSPSTQRQPTSPESNVPQR